MFNLKAEFDVLQFRLVLEHSDDKLEGIHGVENCKLLFKYALIDGFEIQEVIYKTKHHGSLELDELQVAFEYFYVSWFECHRDHQFNKLRN